ncbi:hypothetical protein C1J01_07385 [Nonomuraea aridisoli]|uniref:Uncharacterized protein n=2 Tax=Nonomuraea aridisoli TaxID=2070368 RepID=A0A2W2EA33_9ACTN|nr:hypothetical protein C1J01_07385 [Nonomuraea aridisoli]
MRMAVGDLARAAAGEGWSELVVRRGQVGAYALTTVTCDGREIVVEGMEEPFRRMREVSCTSGHGTWFTCELWFAPGGRGYTGRVDASGPPFAEVPPVAALAELTVFPRQEAPGWLLDALPTAPPLTLPMGGDTHGQWLRGSHNDQPPPPPPSISGDLSYVPATAMTARGFQHKEKRHRHLAVLVRDTDAPKEAHFAVASAGEDCWIIRDRMRATGEGVRSLAVDGTVLRLELTAEAADALETETCFEVLLDLPAEEIERLRTVLPGILRSAGDAPELIGF